MGSNLFHVVRNPQFTALFMLGADDQAETVENVDAELRLPDGTRWSATFMTLGEISRVMNRWKETGENFGGSYFQCPDLVILPEGGVEAMVKSLHGIMAAGSPEGVLGRLE
ncbi:hypothetical protein [Streptomyces sp. NPDC046197]|uniref:hypothetical protein n=1 Tax=Streptomyces sp. NPDC046197 TaxID=3154337 RepID=UPI0034056B35